MKRIAVGLIVGLFVGFMIGVWLTRLQYSYETRAYLVFRFDDGRIGQYSYAKDILARYGYPASTYIISSWPSHGWENKLNWTHIQILHDEYGWEIGSHSRTHPLLLNKTDSELQSEIWGSKQDIEGNLTNVDVHTFSVPSSDWNHRVLSFVNQTYDGMTVGDGGIVNSWSWNRYELHIKMVRNDMRLSEVIGWVQDTIENERLLILGFHDVVEQPTLHTEISIEQFTEIVDYVHLMESKIDVITIWEACQMVMKNS